ncbi:MAG TPA: C25 family cysteine peptidase [Candidatus Cloacimonadota bacterium]|nr:C25 family cysteine peptidase [Candidatus Cloacimonadota bacterium]HQB40728.1 C25 family cysteine peptidase [Candidatus Cloacimonadota bacterium]
MKKYVFLFLIVVSVFSLFAESAFRIVHMSESEIILDFALPAYELLDVTMNNQTYKDVQIENALVRAEEGKPVLPWFSEQIGLPIDGDFTVELQNKKVFYVDNVMVQPTMKMSVSDSEDRPVYEYFRHDMYSVDQYYPLTNISQSESYFFGDSKIRAFHFNPVRFNPVQKKLEFIEKARIKISVSGNKKASPVRTYKQVSDSAGEMLTLNWQYAKNWKKESEKTKEKYRAQQNLTQVSEIQFVIKEEGLYKVTYEDLRDSLQALKDRHGIEYSFNIMTLDPRYFELYDKKGAVPINFVGENDGVFNKGDYFEFYAYHNRGETCYYDNYSNENIYTLKFLDHMGTRMVVENGGLQVINPSGYIAPTSYEQTLHFEKQMFSDRLGYQISQKYYEGKPLRYDREDVLFWKTITAPDLNVTPFELEYPENANTRYFQSKVVMFGSSYREYPYMNPDHHAIVRVNSALVNNKWWSKQNECVFENESNMANSYLVHGTNNLFIDLLGDGPSGYFEQQFLDYFEITYWREYKTDKNEIKFSKPSNRPLGLYQFTVENFSREDISVYKLGSSVFNHCTISPFTEEGGAPYALIFQDELFTEGIEYYACTENKKKKPAAMRLNFPSDLKNPNNRADYIIITARNFIDDEGTQLLKSTWEARNYQVKIVDIQDIYDEFNSSIKSPQAIQDFLKFAYNNWQEPKISNVLLLGDGIYDKRNESDVLKYDIIPVKNFWTFKYGAAASDNWYGCIVGEDPVADINISRIAVFKKEQILPIAQKTVNYLDNPNFNKKWSSKVTLTTGGKIDDATDIFAQQSERIRKQSIPQKYFTQRVYTAAQGDRTAYIGGTFQLKDRINDGTTFLQFMGHGGGRIWSDYNLLNANDIKTLVNTTYPFVSSLSCYASAFDTNGLASIGEIFVAEPNKGAIAHIGFTGLGYLYEDEPFGQFLAQGYFQKNLQNIGDVASFTKASFYGRYGESFSGLALTQSCALIGEPMIPLIRPEETNDISVVGNQYHAAPGDTLRIKGNFENGISSARIMILDNRELPLNIPYDLPVIDNQIDYVHVVPQNSPNPMGGQIKILANSTTKEVINTTNYAVGNQITHVVQTVPMQPTANDSIMVKVRFIDYPNIQSVSLLINPDYFIDEKKGAIEEDNALIGIDAEIIRPLSMNYDAASGFWQLDKKLYNFAVTGLVQFYFKVTKTDGQDYYTRSTYDTFTIHGPDLAINYIETYSRNNVPVIRVFSQNVGNAASYNTSLRLYEIKADNSKVLINEVPYLPLPSMQERWDYLELPELVGNLNLQVYVNELNQDFVELAIGNNYKNLKKEFNLFKAGLNSNAVASLDENSEVSIAANFYHQDVYFNYSKVEAKDAMLQPDIYPVKLLNKEIKKGYQLECFDTNVTDSLNVFYNNKKASIRFYYDKTDSLNTYYANQGKLAVYRWQDVYQKWILQASFINASQGIVEAEVARTGVYALFRNMDEKKPVIEINIEGQEFTVGGYISGKGMLSFMFTDANGIDLFDNTIAMHINGEEVDNKDFAISAIPGHINHIPMKYKLDLPKGDYTISISCTDLNGLNEVNQFSFKVNDKFDLIKIANYPNPVQSKTIDPINTNRTRFTYTLTDDADDVKIKIYTVSGRLVKVFNNLPISVGYHEYPRTIYGWDCSDDKGYPLANGVYFYKVIAKKGNKEIVKNGKMAIIR